MPRPKTDRRWEQRIFALKAQEPQLSAEGMALRFEQEQGGQGHWPAARTIRRILDEEWPKLTPAQRRQYAYFRWPESMEDGSLPWEASTAGLELLRLFGPSRRPPVRLVKWFWRVTQAAPGADVRTRIRAATQLGVEEILGTASETRAIESCLAHQQPYEEGGITLEAREYEDAALEQAFDLMAPGAGRALLKRFKQRRAGEQSEEADNGEARQQ